jgi:hypothetical protein
MMSKKAWISAASVLMFFSTLHAFQRPFREYPGIEYNDFPLPADWQHPRVMFARLMYSAVPRPWRFRYDSPRRPRLAKGLSI